MFGFLKKLWRDKRGNALMIAGAALPLVIGSAGLATDTIEWATMKRQLQRAADSAALAGVYAVRDGQTVSSGNCSANRPIARDLTNGQVSTRLGTTPTCTVETPPASGSWAANTSAVKVTVSAQPQFIFASLFIASAPTISASATAAQVQAGNYCAKALDNGIETGISFSGSATVNLGCGIIANAKGSAAIDAGGSSSVTATPVAAQGQISGSGSFSGTTAFQPYSAPTTDPYSAIDPPTFASSSCTNPGSTVTKSDGTVCYTNLTLHSGDTATFTNEVVIINGGNLDINANATLTCNSCTIIMTGSGTPPSVGNITINGSATVNLTAPTTGTYAGIAIYMDRRAAYCSNCNKINGNSSSSIQGAIYVPTQELQFNGNGGITTDCIQLVSWQLSFTGNTTVTNNCPGGPGGWAGWMVKLVE